MKESFLFPCDQKLAKSQFSPIHAWTKKKITEELEQNAEQYGVHNDVYSPVEVQWAVRWVGEDLWWEGFESS